MINAVFVTKLFNAPVLLRLPFYSAMVDNSFFTFLKIEKSIVHAPLDTYLLTVKLPHNCTLTVKTREKEKE
jgi:hypothetical protein